MIKRHKVLLYFIGLLIAMNLLSAFIILGLGYCFDLTFYQQNVVLLICIPISFISGIFFAIKRFNIDLRFKWTKCKPSIVFYGLFLLMLTYILQVSMDKAFLDSLINGELRFLKFKVPLQGGLYANTFSIMSVFVGPLLEEVFYRRIIFRKLLEQYSLISSMVISSFLFALMHQSIEDLLAYFFVGFIFTYLYHLTKVLWLNVLAHSLYNLLVSVTAIATYQPTDSFYFIGLLIYVFCAAGIFVSIKELRALTA